MCPDPSSHRHRSWYFASNPVRYGDVSRKDDHQKKTRQFLTPISAGSRSHARGRSRTRASARHGVGQKRARYCSSPPDLDWIVKWFTESRCGPARSCAMLCGRAGGRHAVDQAPTGPRLWKCRSYGHHRTMSTALGNLAQHARFPHFHSRLFFVSHEEHQEDAHAPRAASRRI